MAAPRPKRSRFRSRFTASACEIRTCPQNEIHHWDRRGCRADLFKVARWGNTGRPTVVQFQGMIAEYVRAQIAERCWRGKRHRAQQGMVNVLSGAPFGYRYVRKSESSAAYYEVIEAEAKVVRMVFEAYTQQGLSINAIARMLNERRIPTRRATTQWERSTVWGMLRNPAYCGKACYGKTELRPRQRITRPLRQRNGVASEPVRTMSGHGKSGSKCRCRRW
jgi:site-specific DNA recombinase